MGCDIHIYKEVKNNGLWQSVDEWIVDACDGEFSRYVEYGKSAYSGRDYDLFGILSEGVRGRSFHFSAKAKGIPEDCSLEVREVINLWGVDGHSHSWLSLKELQKIENSVNTHNLKISGMMNKDQYANLQRDLEKDCRNIRNLYPYCGWTNQKDFTSFEVDIPADLILAEGLREIIGSLESCCGDEKRIVFFFDN